ncbi:MAG: hypothetical protein EA343_14430 [Nodularia sp. (in: Bacteria)]|nr:MAG: hypothetical protein EA343_14430 [Nodularia sp. (in: cyanobacteria)]
MKGIGYAQNFGCTFSLCEGDLIFLSDQDDVWFQTKIETIQKLAADDEFTQIFINDAELVHHDLSPTGLTKQGQIKSAGFSEFCVVMGCCIAIRRDFLKHLLPIPVQFKGHDVWLSNLGAGLQRRRIISQSLQLYRRYENNESKFIANKTRRINKLDVIINKISKIIGNKIINTSDSHELVEAIGHKAHGFYLSPFLWLEFLS